MDIKPKVLFLNAEHPFSVQGGMGEHGHYLAKHLSEKLELTYLCFDSCKTSFESTYEIYEPQCPIFGPRPPGLACFTENQMIWTMEALKRFNGHNIIHAHDWAAVQVAQRVKYVHPEVKIVQTWHLFQHEILRKEGQKPQLEQLFAEALESFGMRSADHNIAISQHMADYMKNSFKFNANTTLIHNGLDYHKWSSIAFDKELRDTFPQKPLVVFMSRIATQKGVKIIADLIQNDDTYCFVMVCRWFDGAPDAEIPKEDHGNVTLFRDLAKKYPDRIRFTGFKSGDERLPYMAIADKYVLPSICEPWAIAGVEALAAGKPLITTAIGGIGEYASQDNAWIMKAPTWQELKRCLDESDGSKELAGRATAMKYSWEETASKTIDVYNGVLNGSKN